MNEFVVDTHALIWHLEGNARLGPDAKRILNDPSSRLFIPVIVLAEAAWVVNKGKTALPGWSAVLDAVLADPRVSIINLTPQIVRRAMTLHGLEMHDAQIVATARELTDAGHDVVLLGCDSQIVASGLLKVLW